MSDVYSGSWSNPVPPSNNKRVNHGWWKEKEELIKQLASTVYLSVKEMNKEIKKYFPNHSPNQVKQYGVKKLGVEWKHLQKLSLEAKLYAIQLFDEGYNDNYIKKMIQLKYKLNVQKHVIYSLRFKLERGEINPKKRQIWMDQMVASGRMTREQAKKSLLGRKVVSLTKDRTDPNFANTLVEKQNNISHPNLMTVNNALDLEYGEVFSIVGYEDAKNKTLKHNITKLLQELGILEKPTK